MQLLDWLFKVPNGTAAVTAKDRMRTMLVHDRLELPAGKLEVLEEELTAVVARYFDLEPDTPTLDHPPFGRIRVQVPRDFGSRRR